MHQTTLAAKNIEFTEMVVVDVVAGSLQIRHSLESDEGKYECIAENSVGVAYSYGANLYVRGTRWHCISILVYMRLNIIITFFSPSIVCIQCSS